MSRKHNELSVLARVNAVSGPTYATWNPSDKNADITLSNGNLTATTTLPSLGTQWRGVRGDIALSGKTYFELSCPDSLPALVTFFAGIATTSASLSASVVGTEAWTLKTQDGSKVHGSVTAYIGAKVDNGDILCVAVDKSAGKIWWRENNNAWPNSGDPAAGTFPAWTDADITNDAIYPFQMFSASTGGEGTFSLTANFGASSFTYTPPSGFSGLS